MYSHSGDHHDNACLIGGKIPPPQVLIINVTNIEDELSLGLLGPLLIADCPSILEPYLTLELICLFFLSG